jgi:hypothetical protein
LRGRGCETVFGVFSLIAIEKRRGFLELALELQVLGKVADHVDLLLEIVQVLLLTHHRTVIRADYINT